MASLDAIKPELSGPDTGNIPNANKRPFGFRRVVMKTSRNRMCLLSTGDSFDDHTRHAEYPRYDPHASFRTVATKLDAATRGAASSVSVVIEMT
jgi:hypothetical protein